VIATVRGPAGHGSKVVQGGAAAKLGRMLTRLDEHLLPIHITSGLSAMVEAMAAALPEPTSTSLRKLLDPETAEGALEELDELETVFAPLLRNTFNPTIIEGGNAVNVIPSTITVNCDMRLLPGFTKDDGIAEVQQIVGDDVELRVVYYSPNPAVPNFGMFDTLADILREADPTGVPVPYLLSGVTDARFFARLGIQTYGFTPMQLPDDVDLLGTMHNANERIPVEAMDFGADLVYKAIQRFHERRWNCRGAANSWR
jgi:acetylornithine deacetylase/succinyl-diaminopimelate desuccinylase-like protein